jgi:hypothetical protein
MVDMEVDVMRELNNAELVLVSGGEDLVCTPENSYGGITDADTGSDLGQVYESLVNAASRLIEGVANAL